MRVYRALFRRDRPHCVTLFGLVEHVGPPDTFDPRRLGLDHLAFTVATREALDQWAARLADAGVDHSDVIEVPAGGILNFKDPDGIALALFWDRA